MKHGAASLAVAGMLSWGLLSCGEIASPRPQVVLYVDTNAPVVGQLATRPDLSTDAAIDSLHIELLDDNGITTNSLDLPVSGALDWPVSFGIVPDRGAGQIVHVRIRAYNAAFVGASDAETLASSSSVIIDRLVDVTSSSGIVSGRVLLSGDCFSAPATLPKPPEPAVTCVDAARPTALPSVGVELLAAGPPDSSAGTWPAAVAEPCAGTPPAGAACIPGGVTFLGSRALAGVDDPLGIGEAVPLRPVHLTPFFLDVTEFTVGRYRALVQAGAVMPQNPSASDCTWTNGASDDFPLTCVDLATATAACNAEGGFLPSEAQWEHAARGRGQGFQYPWGNTAPLCCSASYGGNGTACPNVGVAPVGSHAGPASPSCPGPFDKTGDGIEDLAGNAREWVSDVYAPYSGSYWNTPIQTDPACTTGSYELVTRGGDASSTVEFLLSALRRTTIAGSLHSAGATQGFRCAYDAGAP